MAMNDRTRSARIAHVLFIDVIGYSLGTTASQGQMIERLNRVVAGSQAFQEALAAQSVHPIPAGDGMALVFFSDVAAPARCAVETAVALRESRGRRCGWAFTAGWCSARSISRAAGTSWGRASTPPSG
ncbi:MAG: hypothetical protein IT210_21570 [Armatimonadetes bacterium]|nr:hypothetical protein [Armatimonadota bacterium]